LSLAPAASIVTRSRQLASACTCHECAQIYVEVPESQFVMHAVLTHASARPPETNGVAAGFEEWSATRQSVVRASFVYATQNQNMVFATAHVENHRRCRCALWSPSLIVRCAVVVCRLGARLLDLCPQHALLLKRSCNSV
jgi:hypothetical protein